MMQNAPKKFKGGVSLRAERSSAKQSIKMLTKQYDVYLLINWNNKVVYVGVTNDLRRRVYEHRNGLTKGFTRRCRVTKLVYYEMCEEVMSAIKREKQIKAGSRQKKIDLIQWLNPKWEDLWNHL